MEIQEFGGLRSACSTSDGIIVAKRTIVAVYVKNRLKRQDRVGAIDVMAD